ncbi:MAG TPA: hypothetical protein VFE98_09815 [Candidatus Bathyarchaeia archaeon]|nr:hypothetical protein [Candidatus Bathyarchaeia archaeon]
MLTRTREILDEILETLEVAKNPRTVKAYREGMRDLKQGRVRSYREFTKELRSSHDL